MAVATTKPIPAPEVEYILTLSKREAEVLRTVCERIGGATQHRADMDSIGRALYEVGIRANGTWVNDSGVRSSIILY